MSYFIKNAVRPSVSSLLWLATGMDGEDIWKDSRPLEVAKSVFVMLFGSPGPAIDSDLKIDNDLLSPFSPSLLPSPLITVLSRPTLARASTSATLVDIEFVSPESQQKPSMDSLKSAEFVHYLLNKPVAPVEDGNLVQGAPIANIVAPLPAARRRGKKRASKNLARWAPDPLERGIRANRPVTGVERLARLQRLSLAV